MFLDFALNRINWLLLQEHLKYNQDEVWLDRLALLCILSQAPGTFRVSVHQT